MFFAKHVLLVEGQTERVLINCLFDDGQIETPKGGIFVLDCLGKHNIHRFMNLLEPLNVSHSVLFDGDGGKDTHEKVKRLIEESKNKYTRTIETVGDDIETFLGIEKSKPHRKPQHVILKLKEGVIQEDRLDAFKNIVERLIKV